MRCETTPEVLIDFEVSGLFSEESDLFNQIPKLNDSRAGHFIDLSNMFDGCYVWVTCSQSISHNRGRQRTFTFCTTKSLWTYHVLFITTLSNISPLFMKITAFYIFLLRHHRKRQAKLSSFARLFTCIVMILGRKRLVMLLCSPVQRVCEYYSTYILYYSSVCLPIHNLYS
jgi:hypothetical protein